MGQNQYNYTSAFALYAQGHPLEDIAHTLDIPIEHLKSHSNRMGWRGHATALQSYYTARNDLAVVAAPADHSLAVKKLQGNRDANYDQALKLRKLAEKTIQDWILACDEPDSEGHTLTPSPKSLKELASAVATIHELTYRALGDAEAKKDPSQPDRASGAPQITINLPGVLVNPRGAKTIDLPSVQSSGQSTSEKAEQ